MASFVEIKWIYTTKYEICEHERSPYLPLGLRIRSVQSTTYDAQSCYTAVPAGEQEKGGRRKEIKLKRRDCEKDPTAVAWDWSSGRTTNFAGSISRRGAYQLMHV